MAFRTWTVLPHQPIEKLSDRLWTVSGTMPKGNIRRMTLLRLSDGRVLVHNAIALGEAEMKEVEAWGEVAGLIVPNGFHRQDAFIYKKRYPRAAVYAPQGSVKAVGKLVSVDGDFTQIPSDQTIRFEHLAGMKKKEGVLTIDDADGRTLIFNDALLNMSSQGILADLFMSPVGTLSVPRFARMMWLNDRNDFVDQMTRLSCDLNRIIVGHGQTVEEDATSRFAEAIDRLR